jgi:hypothetical protein
LSRAYCKTGSPRGAKVVTDANHGKYQSVVMECSSLNDKLIVMVKNRFYNNFALASIYAIDHAQLKSIVVSRGMGAVFHSVNLSTQRAGCYFM